MEKISEMIIHATLIRSTLEAATAELQHRPPTAPPPSQRAVRQRRQVHAAAANYNVMVRHLHDIAGGAALTAPAPADFENEGGRALARKYMATSKDVDGEYRSMLMAHHP
ncbi:MAG: 4-hydroxyphenylacetate 3-hydroxylase C-terminal domain-containing protein [Acidimicrobiales bacterium]